MFITSNLLRDLKTKISLTFLQACRYDLLLTGFQGKLSSPQVRELTAPIYHTYSSFSFDLFADLHLCELISFIQRQTNLSYLYDRK